MVFVENIDEMVSNAIDELDVDMYTNSETDTYEFHVDGVCILEAKFDEKGFECVTSDDSDDYKEILQNLEAKLKKLHVELFGA